LRGQFPAFPLQLLLERGDAFSSLVQLTPLRRDPGLGIGQLPIPLVKLVAAGFEFRNGRGQIRFQPGDLLRLGLHLAPGPFQRFLFRPDALQLFSLARQIVSGALQRLLQVVHVLLTRLELTRQLVERRLASGAVLFALLNPPLTGVGLAAVDGLFTLQGGLDLLHLLPLLLNRFVAGTQLLIDPGHDVGPGLHLLLNGADCGAELLTESKNLGGSRVRL